jgi:pimeloyl-ACP methyl ester carboxylesterase
MSTFDMADLVADALAELGIERYVVSGGDIGSSVAEHLAASHADPVSALHLTDVPYSHLFAVDAGELSQPERDYLDAGRTWQIAEGPKPSSRRPNRAPSRPHSATRRSGCSPGSWRSCGPGVTPAATWSRSTPATSCSPG